MINRKAENTMAKNKSVLRIAALLLAMAMLLLTAACGKDEKKPAETTAATTAVETSAEETTQDAGYPVEDSTPLPPGTDTDVNGETIEDVLNAYFLSVETKDGELYLAATSMLDEMTPEQADTYVSDAIANFESQYGGNIRISYSVVSSTRANTGELGQAKYLYRLYGLDGEVLTDEYLLEMEITIKGNNSEEVITDSFVILKENGKWVVCENSGTPGA